MSGTSNQGDSRMEKDKYLPFLYTDWRDDFNALPEGKLKDEIRRRKGNMTCEGFEEGCLRKASILEEGDGLLPDVLLCAHCHQIRAKHRPDD